MKYFNVSVLVSVLSLNLFGMEFKPVKLSTWSKGESIYGEEFIAATEAVVDYLATLPRPTGPTLQPMRFNCQVKMRYIRPDLNTIGSNPPVNGSVDIQTVYDIKDCVPIP